ncbi:MAG: HNH endonuclease family protein [Bdellovibrio sp.]
MERLLLIVAFVACGWNCYAENSDVAANNPRFDQFYTVDEQATNNLQSTSMNPVKAAEDFFNQATQVSQEIRSQVISLLKFDHHAEEYGNVGEPYNRKNHFGGWLRDKTDGTCLNTRGKVLVRDSKTPAEISNCLVSRGEWDEPYKGQVETRAQDIQIDHFVPLKNAYVSGAWRWNFAKRCLYANFLGNDFHLLSVDGHENMSKSDNTPELYMPPNEAYRCQYLQQWLKVKLIWNLGLTPPEKSAVESLIQQNHCDLSRFTYTVKDLEDQRRFMADHANLCD